MTRQRRPTALGIGLLFVVACTGSTAQPPPTTLVGQPGSTSTVGSSAPTTASATQPRESTSTTTTRVDTTTTTRVETTTTVSEFAPPDWLGTRVLAVRSDGFGESEPTPPELAPRAIATPDHLPPPSSDTFEWTAGSVPTDVLDRSTWSEECPVAVGDLAYLTLSHHGFDGELHTGEMIVDAAWADQVVEVFSRLFDVRYPIEEMRVIDRPELDAPPTGDGNVTTSFVCRPAVGSGSWSQHAYGRAIDLNPFQNPYLKGDLVLPELAEWYVDRERTEPGMVHSGDATVQAFAAIGWEWGGDWTTLKDWMHFSANGR